MRVHHRAYAVYEVAQRAMWDPHRELHPVEAAVPAECTKAYKPVLLQATRLCAVVQVPACSAVTT